MSARLMGLAFYAPILSTKKLLLVALADHASDDGSDVFPGVPRLAIKCSISERHVQRLLRKFEAEG